MSRIEPKAGEWLRQQIEELGALRTASVRDPQFKAWRQNTLTFIQRIWPGEQPRSERFRRIPFSPPSTRADARAIREQFERGCGEALEYLNTLLAAVGEEPVKAGTVRTVPLAESSESSAIGEGDFAETSSDDGEVGGADALEGVIGDGPLLDLPDPHAPTPERSKGPTPLPAQARSSAVPEGLPDDFAGATPLDGPAPTPTPSKATPMPEAKPAPPASKPPADPPGPRISVRGSGPAGSNRPPESNPLKGILDPHRKPPPAEGRPGKGGKFKKGGKRRLKDMLGLDQLGSRAPTAPPSPPEAPRKPRLEVVAPDRPAPAATSTPPAPTSASTPPAPTAASTPPASVPVSAPAVPRASFTPPSPPATGHHEPPPVEHTPEPSRPRATPSGLDDPDRWTMPGDLAPPSGEAAEEPLFPLTADDVEPSNPEEESLPMSEPLEAAPETVDDPFEPSPEADEHAGDAARATAEFLRTSPVLSSAPRPVSRRTPAGSSAHAEPIPSRDSAASQILAIASEVDSLGVPEGHRARARAALMDLARQLDEPEISWDVLRDAVQFVMEFPPIARRALPLLLPFLDVAA